MHPISPALLAAATSWAAEPVAQAIIEDRRVRWGTLHTWPAGYDASPTAMFHNGSTLLRACVDGTGQVLLARVDDPDEPADWEAWSVVATGARAGSDVAIGWWAPFTWALLYESASGMAALLRTSSDGGVTWSAPLTLHTATAAPWFALWGRWALVLEASLHAYHWNGSAWDGPYTLSSATPSAAGVAAWYDAAAQRLHVLYASAGRLHRATLDSTAAPPTWDSPRVLAPGGDQPASSLAACALPALAWVPSLGLVATWQEAYSGDLSTLQSPVSLLFRGPNYDHPGQFCPLALAATSAQRWPLAYDALTQTLYCGGRRAVLSAPVFDAAVRTWMRLGPTDALAWRWQAGTDTPGRLTLEILDPSGHLRNPGDPASGAAAARPLASLGLRRGYRTTAGEETVDTAGWTVLSAAFSEGLGGGRLQVDAVDAFGVLGLWRPAESLVWLDRSVLWLLEEICARVGLAVAREGDGSSTPGLDTVLPSFALHPHHTALTAVQALLRLGQAVARPAAEDTLLVLALPDGTGTLPVLGAASEIREGAYGSSAVEATHVRVTSPAGGVFAEAESLAGSQAMGARLTRVLEDNRVNTAALAGALAAHTLALAALEGRADRATVPLRPDLEVWDAVELVVPAGALPAGDDGARVIVAIEEDVCPSRNRYETRMRLGGVS
ncbi:MAG: hypothetical protein ACYCYF_10480 [Anaerolineae bacterium]